MPYILYPLGAAAQDNCHCQLSSSRDIGVRTRGGRALCAYLRLRELGSAAFCRRCDKIAHRATDEVVAKSYLMLFDVICIKSKC